jgi:pro-apoptotic serine protease NMA111
VQVLRVRSRLAGSDASKQLRDGDMLLAINKIPVWGFRDIEAFVNGRGPTSAAKRPHSVAFPEGGAVQGAGPGPPDGEAAHASLALTIFRDHQITDVPVQLGHETGRGTEHMVHWCGAQLQVWTMFLCMQTKLACSVGMSTFVFICRAGCSRVSSCASGRTSRG